MPPLAIAAGIAAVGTIGGAIIGSGAQTSAANQANEAQQAATQAQLQLGQESLALNQGIYNSNYQTLSPFVSRGNVAGDQINALLGLPAAPAMQSPLASGSSGTAPASGGLPTGSPGQFSPSPAPVYGMGGLSPANTSARMGGEPSALPTIGPQANGDHIATSGLGALNVFNGAPGGSAIAHPGTAGTPTTGGPATAGSTPAASAISPQSALNNFANSAGMQFQLQQGTNALNNMYAARGMVQSGAAMKGINDYAQQTALNNYFMPYMGLLGGQQAVGAGAASSIAGVGANFGNTAAAINAGMGANIQSGANSASNAALARGAANAGMWSGIGSALGGLGSSFAGGFGGGSSSGSVTLPAGDGFTGGWLYPGVG